MSIDQGVAQLEKLLEGLPAEQLASLVGQKRFLPLHRLVAPEDEEQELSSHALARYAVALDGRRLLNEPEILSALLLGLGHVPLRRLARRHVGEPFARDADNARALSAKPLRRGSALARDVTAALGISEVLLSEDPDRKSAVETVEPYDPLPPLLDFQRDVQLRCLDAFGAGVRELLIQMPTGSGKTRTAMELLVTLAPDQGAFGGGGGVVWLAHTEELCEQAVDAFASVWATRGVSRLKVVRLWGGYSPTEADLSGGLVVASTARLYSLRRSDAREFHTLCAQCRIIVLDEAHRALGPTVQAVIQSLRAESKAVLIGLSATPARGLESTEDNVALAKFFGRNLVAPALGADPIAELRRRGILARLNRVELKYRTSIDLDMSDADSLPSNEEDLPDALLTTLASNRDRNAAILAEVVARVANSEPTIVFCCSVAHSRLLAAALRLKRVRALAVDCRMRRGDRRSAVQQFARGDVDVLLNFGVLSTGFDAPKVRAVLIARPTKSVVLYSQMLGRGLRGPRVGGTEECTLIDIRDNLGRFGSLNELYGQFQPYWRTSAGASEPASRC